MMEPIKKILPTDIRAICSHLGENTEEIRLRAGAPPYVLKSGAEYIVPAPDMLVHAEQLEQLLHAACGGSRYAVQDSLRKGFLVLPGGHRLSFCGEAAVEDGKLLSFRHISSVAIRIARQCIGCGLPLSVSTLIMGPPGSGKTTLLRDTVRILSDECGFRVCLADERGEIAACREGIPQFAVGRHTDVLSGMNKADGVLMLLKNMNPQWIAVDEITSPADVEAMIQVMNCGVKLLATAHADSVEDLLKRRAYLPLLQHRCFSRILLLRADHAFTMEEVPIFD